MRFYCIYSFVNHLYMFYLSFIFVVFEEFARNRIFRIVIEMIFVLMKNICRMYNFQL